MYTKQIGLTHISVEIPQNRLDNSKRSEELDFTNEFILNKIGSPKVSRLDAEDNTLELAFKAVNKLFHESGLDVKAVDLLVLVTQNPGNGGIPHLSASLHHKVGLRDDAQCFDISLGCSGWVHGLAIVKSYCESFGFKNAILVTADPYSTIIDPNDRNTVLLFGDGASATWLSDQPVYNIGQFYCLNDTSSANAIQKKAGEYLQMNGRRVLDFAKKNVPACITKTLELNNQNINQIDVLYAHQGSKYIVDQLREALNILDDKMPYSASEYGNLVSSSIPALIAENYPNSGEKLLVCGFGVGLSCMSTVLFK